MTIEFHCLVLALSVRVTALRAGTSEWWMAIAAATCMAVGKVSLDDCPMFTWALG